MPWGGYVFSLGVGDGQAHSAHRAAERHFDVHDVIRVGLLGSGMGEHLDRPPTRHPDHRTDHQGDGDLDETVQSSSRRVALAIPPPSQIACNPQARPGALHLVHEGGHQPRSRTAERMAESDGTAIRVHLVQSAPVSSSRGADHRGECLVHLNNPMSSTPNPDFSSTLNVAGMGRSA